MWPIEFKFDSDQIRVVFGDGTYVVTSEQKFRDSRWYHFVFAVDTNQFNAFDRIKCMSMESK